MNQLPVLVRREFWEYRNAFLVVPAVVTGFFLLLMLLTTVASTNDAIDMTIDIRGDGSSALITDVEMASNIFEYAVLRLQAMPIEQRAEYIAKGLQVMSAPLMFVLWIVVFFYLLNCLYTDRRDRSILFWKSLPVSDAMTVLTKLFTGLLLVPLVYLAGVAVLQMAILLLLSINAPGSELSVWESIWSPASLLTLWLNSIGLLLFYSLWALPFYAWLVAVSAYAKSVPLAWALGVPIAISIAEGIFSNGSLVSGWMKAHIIPVGFLDETRSVLEVMSEQAFSMQMVSALVVGGVLIAAAIWLRGRADEI